MQTVALRLWTRLQEPRVLSAIQGAIYIVVTTIGMLGLVLPPPTITNTVGYTLSALWAGLLTVGGLLGATSVVGAAWWLERVALIAVIAAEAMLMVTIAAGPHQKGTQIVLFGLVTWAMLSSIQRAVRIHRYPYDPER